MGIIPTSSFISITKRYFKYFGH